MNIYGIVSDYDTEIQNSRLNLILPMVTFPPTKSLERVNIFMEGDTCLTVDPYQFFSNKQDSQYNVM